MSVSCSLLFLAWYIYYQKHTTDHVAKRLLKKGGSIMRFHDVQDLTKTIKSEQRNAAYKRMHDAFLDRLSVFDSNKRMTVFGATFIF